MRRSRGQFRRMTLQVDETSDAGESRAEFFRELHGRFRRPLLAYFTRRGAGLAEAEDLTHDVYERVLRSYESRTVLNLEALIFRIALNLLRDRARKRRVRGEEESLDSDDVTGLAEALTVDLTPERVVMGERTLEQVLRALDELNARTRAMFCLYRFDNLKVREIAEIYGISPSAVEKQIATALGHLARRLQLK